MQACPLDETQTNLDPGSAHTFPQTPTYPSIDMDLNKTARGLIVGLHNYISPVMGQSSSTSLDKYASEIAVLLSPKPIYGTW